MDPIVWPILTSVATVATTTTGIINWLNRKFSDREKFDIQMSEKIEHLAYLINSNTELINHRTNRFNDGVARLEELNRERLTRLEQSITTLQIRLCSRIEDIEKRVRDLEQFESKVNGYALRESRNPSK